MVKVRVKLRRLICETAEVDIDVPGEHADALEWDSYEIQEAAENKAFDTHAWEQTEADPPVDADWEVLEER